MTPVDGNGKSDTEGGWTYRAWYARNKEEVSARRKARYWSSKKYRKKVLLKNKRYRDERIARKEDVDEDDKDPRPPPGERLPVTVPVRVYGKVTLMEMVYIGTFAAEIGKSVQTVYYWERAGLFPKTPFFIQRKVKKERLYCAAQIKVVRAELRKRNNRISSQDPTFHDDVANGWALAGIEIEK